jgi:1-phosphatidylinositol-3-phosphate 5-kinase
VASARAKVEILESIKDAINDESESSDSSEADHEGDGSDKARQIADKTPPEPVQETTHPEPECVVPLPSPLLTPPPIVTPPEETPTPQITSDSPPEPAVTYPSPVLPVAKRENASPLPPEMELEHGPTSTEPVSILKAISGLWLPQSRNREALDAEDPMSDPEHIFRDSSMVVRTDEPTSIIALALKYVFAQVISMKVDISF